MAKLVKTLIFESIRAIWKTPDEASSLRRTPAEIRHFGIQPRPPSAADTHLCIFEIRTKPLSAADTCPCIFRIQPKPLPILTLHFQYPGVAYFEPGTATIKISTTFGASMAAEWSQSGNRERWDHQNENAALIDQQRERAFAINWIASNHVQLTVKSTKSHVDS
jgi:hypothetical protein